MFKFISIYSDNGEYEINASILDDSLYTYDTPSFKNEKKGIYWDNDEYLYNDFYKDLKEVVGLKEKFQSRIAQFFAKYSDIEVDKKSEVNIDLIDELYEMFQEAESMGFFNEVIEEELQKKYNESRKNNE